MINLTQRRLAMESNETTESMKPKTIQEVSAQIRSAGLKSEDSAGKKETVAPPKEEGKEELGETEGEERPDNGGDGDSVIESPTPTAKDPAEMEKDPNEFLDPAPVETRPADDVEPGTEPNVETDENLDGDKNEAPENKVNENVLNDMGGGTLNDALKKTFGDFLEKAKMSRLSKSTYKGIEYEISKRGKNADNNTPWEVWVEGQKINGFWYSATDAGKAAREYIDESFSENDMKKMSRLGDDFKPGDKVIVTETSKFTFGDIEKGEKGTVVEVYTHASVKGFVKVKIGDKTPVFPPRSISKLSKLADEKGALSFNDHPANNTKVSDKEYVEFLKMAISKLEEAISKASQGGAKIQMQRELKHWKSELKYMEDSGKRMSRLAVEEGFEYKYKYKDHVIYLGERSGEVSIENIVTPDGRDLTPALNLSFRTKEEAIRAANKIVDSKKMSRFASVEVRGSHEGVSYEILYEAPRGYTYQAKALGIRSGGEWFDKKDEARIAVEAAIDEEV